MAQVPCRLFFVIMTCMLLGCNCSFKQLIKSVYRPYGPKMCRQLCSSSADSFLYLTEDLTCYRIKMHESRRRENRTQENLSTCSDDKMKNDITVFSGWDICNKEYAGKGKNASWMSSIRSRDYMCSPYIQSAQDNRDLTLLMAGWNGELGVVKYIISHGIADINCHGQMERTPVMKAAGNGQVAVFDFFVSQGCDLSNVDKRKNNVLHIACMSDSIDIVGKLLNFECCSIEIKGELKRTPIMMATLFGSIGVVKYLVGRRCNLSAVDEDGDTILHTACTFAKVNMVKYILTLGIGIESLNKDNRTPLMVAARQGNGEVVEYLVSIGVCQLHKVDKFGNNVLHLACISGNVGLVEFILTKGIVDIDSLSFSRNQTPVMIAAYNGHGRVVELLISKGCDQTAVDKYGNNILHQASFTGHVKVVKYILSLGIVDIDSKGSNGRTPVMKAVKHNRTAMFELLVRNGCNLTTVDIYGNNILHLACISGNVDLIQFILTKGIVDIDSLRFSRNQTPVMIAAYRGHGKVVELLISKGCDQTAVNKDGNNILHQASFTGLVKVVKYILNLGIVDIDSKGSNGRTPVMKAIEQNRTAVFELLMRNGCNLKTVDIYGNNILHLACVRGRVDIVKHLLTLSTLTGMENRKNKDGNTPVQLARLHNYANIVAVFQSRKSEIE